MQSQKNEIKKEVSKSAINVSRVYSSDYQKEGTLTAELKQVVSTKSYYPSKSVTNSLNGNIFSTDDFGFEDKEFENKETRVAWIDVPAGSSEEAVKAKLATVKDATLYKILSNKPILSDSDKYAVDNDELDVTIDNFANKQVIRYPQGHSNAGQLVTDKNGKVQYRRIAFATNLVEDQDLRTEDPTDFYASPEIEAELNSTVHIMEGQSL